MTALESLASRSLEKSQILILGSAASNSFAERVRALVDEREEFDDSVKDAIKRKIPELNRYSFTRQARRPVGTMACCSNIAIDDSELKRLVRLRNSIVHEGGTPKEEELWPSILVVREILARLALAMLQIRHADRCRNLRRADPPCDVRANSRIAVESLLLRR